MTSCYRVRENEAVSGKNSYVLDFSLQGSGDEACQTLKKELSRTFLLKSKI